jgi:hypothetical protein
MELKLNWFRQFLVHIDSINLFGTKISSINSINKSINALFDVNMYNEKIRYVFGCQQWNPGQNHNIKIDNKCLKYENNKYLETK